STRACCVRIELMKRAPIAFLLLSMRLLAGGGRAAEERVTHRVLASDKGRVAIVNERGQVEWEVSNPYTCHDIVMLPNGNVLFPTSDTTLVEMTPEKKIVWQHVSRPKPGYDGKVEIHAFQRLPDGLTMVAETGNLRIIEVDRDDKIVREVPL